MLIFTVMAVTVCDIQKGAHCNHFYVDGMFMAGSIRLELESNSYRWKVRLRQYGLELNIKKTQDMEEQIVER